MKIIIDSGGLWGNYIPDVFRSKTITLHFDNLSIKLSGKDYEAFKELLSEKQKELWEQCEVIVEKYDKKCDASREFVKKMEALKLPADVSNAFYKFCDDFWSEG
jgi:hypothetical protein